MVPVAEASQTGEVRRAAAVQASRAGLDEDGTGRLALVVTEAATNLVKHARLGEIHLSTVPGTRGVDVLAIDRGPGIPNLEASLRDGFSTSGSPGTGLGAIRRLSSTFDVWSDSGGTAVISRVANLPAAKDSGLDVGVVSVPHPHERECGDAWSVNRVGRAWRLLVVDGLGHGVKACEAARRAIDLFQANPGDRPAEALQRMHEGMRGTRGAAASVAWLDPEARLVTFSGVGNISGSVCVVDGARNMVSQHGTLGYDVRRFQEFQYPWPDHAVVVLHSDGIGTRWDLARYPGLLSRHPALMAGILYRDFRRERDDATVLVARES